MNYRYKHRTEYSKQIFASTKCLELNLLAEDISDIWGKLLTSEEWNDIFVAIFRNNDISPIKIILPAIIIMPFTQLSLATCLQIGSIETTKLFMKLYDGNPDLKIEMLSYK